MPNNVTDELTANLLQTAILALRQNVVPSLPNGSARIHADLVTRVLYMLQARFSHRGADLQKLIAGTRTLLSDATGLVPDQGSSAGPPPGGEYFSEVDRLERELFHLEVQLTKKMPELVKLAGGDSPRKARAVQLLRRMFDLQQTFLLAQDPDISKGSYICYQGGFIDSERPHERLALYGADITADSLTAHLQQRFPGCQVEELSLMAGGFSKTTMFFTLAQASGQREALVIRKDLPVEFVTPITYEFPLLQQIHKAGFPVAEPLWVESDPQPFGGCFMVSRRVGGSTDISRWASDPNKVELFARQLAKTMADLHALKLNQLAFPADVAGASAGAMTLAEIERWNHKLLRDRRREAHPIEELALNWLKANIPAAAFERRAVLVHGDIGFHNLMIDAGNVTALLDWEFSHPGDPIEDLIYTKPFIEKVMDWETFKSYYREYGGASHTAEEEFFYIVWAKTRSPVNGAQAGTLFAESIPNELKFAVAGFVLARYLGVEAGRMIVDSFDTKAL